MFKGDIAAAVAGYFLTHAPAHELNDLRLMKLMYMAEREAIITLGGPITGARFQSLPKGPVLKEVLDLMQGQSRNADWNRHIGFRGFDSAKSNHCYLAEPIRAEEFLSDEELRLLSDIWLKHRYKSKWELVDLTHEFPEWNPSVAEESAKVKSLPIPLLDILVKGFEVPEAEAREQVANIEYFEAV